MGSKQKKSSRSSLPGPDSPEWDGVGERYRRFLEQAPWYEEWSEEQALKTMELRRRWLEELDEESD